MTDCNRRIQPHAITVPVTVVFEYASVTRTKSKYVGMPNKEFHAPSESIDMLLQLEITTRFKSHSSRYGEGFMVFLSSPHECSETSHHRYHRNLLLFTSHDNFIITSATIQSDSGWKVNILWGDSIGHCEKKKVRTNMWSWTVTEIQLFESTNTKPLWTVIKDEKLLIVDFIWILISCLNK
jgi:hypothetical protein